MAPIAPDAGADFQQLLGEAFRQAGWKVESERRAGKWQIDLLVRRRELVYAVELKRAPEGRRDRVIPLLAQAVLQAKAMAQEVPAAAPLVVIASARIPDSLARAIQRFVDDYAPDVAVGVIDHEGFREFVGKGLEDLNSPRRREAHELPIKAGARPHLFSDLNQWLLKVLLAPGIPEHLLSAPRAEYRRPHR